MLGQINPTGVNEALTTITSTLNSININEVNTLVENVSGAADVIVRSEPLVQGALKAITFSPIIQGINCLLSLGTLITGILTVRELKNIKQELVLIRNELTAANEKLDEMIRLLNIQIVLSRQIAEGIDRIDHSVSFRGKQDEIINQRNISNIRDHYKEGRYKESIQYSNECLKFKLPEIFYYRGLSLYELGHYFAAIENFTKAFELDKHNVEYLYWRGLCSLHLNLTENAKKDFQRILQVRPTWPQLEAHLCLIASNYANAAQKYAEITRQRNAREAVSPEIKKYNLYYLMGLARLGSENRNDAEVAFSLAALGTSSKMTEIRLFLQIHDGDNTQLSDTELQYLEAGLSNNMTTTAINFMAQNQGLIFNYSNGDVTLLNKLRNGARTNQLNAKHAKSLYLLAQQLIKLNELVEGMYFCKLAADLGNIEAQQQIIKCHEILEGTQTFSSFVNWNFVKAAVQATFIGFQLTTEQKNWSLAKYYAAIIHFRGLFNKEKIQHLRQIISQKLKTAIYWPKRCWVITINTSDGT
ncbi:MAG: tetratricopeptide repeat protein [Coxiellaceae bacterium]|nr:MAG: tetratricopeptide repeat protein [Coxiellaceae bacterium]